MALLAWLAGLALLGLGKSAAAESEECLLLQALGLELFAYFV